MKRFLKILAAVVAVLVLTIAALVFFVDVNRFRPGLETQLSLALQRPVHLGDLRLSLFAGGASSSELTISDDPAFSSEPFLKSGLFEVGVDFSALIFSRELRARSITINDASITLIRKQDGTWNFSTLGVAPPTVPAPPTAEPPPPEPPKAELSVNSIRIDKARVHLIDSGATHDFQKVDFELRDFAPAATMPFSLTGEPLGGGKIDIGGKAGPLSSIVALTPFDAKVQIEGWDLDPGGIDGVVQFQGSANSNGKTAAVTGAMVIDKVQLSKNGKPATRPMAMNLALAHDLKTNSGSLGPSTLKLGSATANLKGTYNSGSIPTSDLVLSGEALPFDEVVQFLPAMDVQLPTGASLKGGTVTANITVQSRGAASTTKGTAKIENTRLENYDLVSKFNPLQHLAGVSSGSSTDLVLVFAVFENNVNGTQVRNIRVDVPSLGQVTGEGSVSPEHALNFRMKAAKRSATIPFSIRGTSSNPTFQADVRQIAKDPPSAVETSPAEAKKGNPIVNKAKGLLDFFKRNPKKDDKQK
jgi:AsmA protein